MDDLEDDSGMTMMMMMMGGNGEGDGPFHHEQQQQHQPQQPETTTIDLLDALHTVIFKNFSILVNGTRTEEDKILIKKYSTNRRIDGPLFYCLITAYILLILFGTIGNCLVVSSVVRKPTMRTARNMFIINLAISDLLLCVITMPVTLMEILTQYWPFGRHVFLCKLFGSLQATSIFVSTISISAIALDRYHVIVYPTRPSVQRVGAVVVLALIWCTSFILAAPLYFARKYKHIDFEFPAYGLDGVDFCLEEWPWEHGRAYYSIFTILIQYVLPITVVSVAYARICRKLRYRMKPGSQPTVTMHSTTAPPPQLPLVETAGNCGGNDVHSTPPATQPPQQQQQPQRIPVANSGRQARDNNRVRKTNTLLISISVVFGVSWMPLNVLNVIVDLTNPSEESMDSYLIVYAVCHMIGMSSACSNPVLYGWLNENFRKEFKDIWSSMKCKFFHRRENNNTGRELLGSHHGGRGGRIDREPTTVHFKKSNASPNDEDLEQSTLITQVIDRHK